MTIGSASIIWPANAAEAIAQQEKLRYSVRLENRFHKIETIAGIDVSYDPKFNITRAIIALIDFPNLELQQSIITLEPTTFPYIPGLLSFRELPAILKALKCLVEPPDLLMVDGQGIAHPRRLGIAAHLSVLTGMPAIGVAKSRLTGSFTEPGSEKGARASLTDKGEVIGTVLRTKDNVAPLFVSPGHLVDHETAVALTLQCTVSHRLPEPTRIADKISKMQSVKMPSQGSLF